MKSDAAHFFTGILQDRGRHLHFSFVGSNMNNEAIVGTAEIYSLADQAGFGQQD